MKTARLLEKIFEMIYDNILNDYPIFRRLIIELNQYADSERDFDIFKIKLVLTAYGCCNISYAGSPEDISEGDVSSSSLMTLKFDVPNEY